MRRNAAAPNADPGVARRTDALTLFLYDELRALARRLLERERAGVTLQPTALVHEAYVRVARDAAGNASVWNGRGHFFRAAAIAMRRILVERARWKGRERHGGGQLRVPLESLDDLPRPEPDRCGALEEALEDLERIDPSAHEVVLLRAFAGLGVDEAASVLGVSARHVKREWAAARLYLYRRLAPENRPGAGAPERGS
jgi:RNA polymerase sigma factor (TIGR02999 family)